MGRREQPVAPGPLHDFANGLRELRAEAGLTYRELAEKAGFSSSALSAAAKGDALPTLDVTLAYVGACAGDMAEWESRWRTAKATPAQTEPDEPVTEPAPQPVPRRTGRRARIAFAGLALATVAGVAVVALWPSTHTPAQNFASGSTPAVIPGPSTTTAATSPPAPTSESPKPAAAAPSSAAHSSTTQPAAPAPPPPITFAALTGESCPQDSSKGVFDSGSSAWARHNGGWTADGCTGAYVSASVHDSTGGNNTFTWWFATGQVPNGSCDVRVFVPAGGNLASADPAGYKVYNGPLNSPDNHYVAGFTIDQRDNQGAWVSAGSYPTRDGFIEFRLDNQGSGSAYVAAQTVSISCHP